MKIQPTKNPCIAACWLVLALAGVRPGSAQDATQFAPLPDGWKGATFGMTVEQILVHYPDAVPEKDDVDLLQKTYVLTSPDEGIGRVTFFFFKDVLFKIAINFDLSRAQQRYQIYLYEKKYGPCQEKEINFQGADNTTKLVWHNRTHAIQIGQIVLTPKKKDAVQEHYLAAIYIDIQRANECEEHTKKVGAQKHKVEWDDF